jgi:hypothetical protein
MCYNSKFIYRWQSTKYFAKEAEEKSRRISPNDNDTKDIKNNNFYDNVNRKYNANIGAHKYSLTLLQGLFCNKEEGGRNPIISDYS